MCNVMTIQMVLWLSMPFALLFLHNRFYQVMTTIFGLLLTFDKVLCDTKQPKVFFVKKCIENTFSDKAHQTYE